MEVSVFEGLKGLIDQPQKENRVSSFQNKAKSFRKTDYYPAAIEISSSSLKLLQFVKNQNSFQVAKADYLPIERNLDASATVKKSFERLIKDNQLSGPVVTSLSINEIQSFSFSLPNMPEAEIQSAVLWKLKQNLPAGSSLENMHFDYVTSAVSKDKNIKDMIVLVFLISKEIISGLIKFFKEFSLELVSVEPKPYAVLEALVWLNKISPTQTLLLLQLGASFSSVTIISGGQPYLVRPLSVSGNNFSEAIANYYRFDWQRAENLKRQEGLDKWNSKPAENKVANDSLCFPALSSQLEGMVIDIEHTFKYFSHQLTKSQITAFDRVIISGGTAGLLGFDRFLNDRLGAQVEIFNPLRSIEQYVGDDLNLSVTANAFSFASTVGLASRYIENA